MADNDLLCLVTNEEDVDTRLCEGHSTLSQCQLKSLSRPKVGLTKRFQCAEEKYSVKNNSNSEELNGTNVKASASGNMETSHQHIAIQMDLTPSEHAGKREVEGAAIGKYSSFEALKQGRPCIGKVPIGEKCFALLMVSLVAGTLFLGLGTACLIPQVGYLDESSFCQVLGGLITASTLVCIGGLLVAFTAASCTIISKCSGRALHGGKCHVNCHIFEDLIE